MAVSGNKQIGYHVPLNGCEHYGERFRVILKRAKSNRAGASHDDRYLKNVSRRRPVKRIATGTTINLSRVIAEISNEQVQFGWGRGCFGEFTKKYVQRIREK